MPAIHPNPRREPLVRQIVIDTANRYMEGVGRVGISRTELATQATETEQAQWRIQAGGSGSLSAEYAALNLAHELPAQLPQIRQMAADLRRHQDVLLIGIGGAKALQQALAPQSVLAGTPRLHLVENIDPYFLQRGTAR